MANTAGMIVWRGTSAIVAIGIALVVADCATTVSSPLASPTPVPSSTPTTPRSPTTPTSSPSTPAVSTSPEATPAWPTGGPVPLSLVGIWYFPLHSSEITLSGNDYVVVQSDPPNNASGKVVVNGNEIDFFNGPCGMLPGHLGRYRWTLRGKTSVHFAPLNADPCGRTDILVNATWTRARSPAPSS